MRHTNCLRYLVLAAALASSAGAVHASEFTVYHVGNSLSQDLFDALFLVADRYEQAQGDTYSYGVCFRGSTCLPFFYENPNAADIKSAVDLTAYRATPGLPGNSVPWPTALPGGDWDVVTLQPHGIVTDQGSNLLSDNIADINGFIASARANAANASTRFLIYSTWDGVSLTDPDLYSNFYSSSTINQANPDLTQCSQARDFVLLLCDRVRQTNPDVDLLPLGEVHYELDALMQGGAFDDFTDISQLHRDVIHANSAGQNVAAWTAYAVIYKQSPVGLQNDIHGHGVAGGFTNVTAMTDHDRFLMQSTIWDTVVAMNAYTNVVAAGVAPTVTSAAAASGTVGQGFAYQITATGSPTSYNATGLPAGLTVHTGTGLIDGTPAAAGVSTVTLSATNAAGTGTTTLTITTSTPTVTYTLTVTDGTGDGEYEQGVSVNISADAPPTGQVFDQWTGDVSYVTNVTSAATTVTMPAQAVTVAATYADVTFPVASWSFDDASPGTTALDSSGNGNDGTLTNMAGTEWTTGRVGGALVFDGVDDDVTASSSADFYYQDGLSFACWFKTDNGSATQTVMVHEGGGRYVSIVLFGTALRWQTDAGQTVWANTSLPASQWYHVVGTYDSVTSTAKVYVNGQYDTQATLTGQKDFTSFPFHIGRRDGSPYEPFAGIIDEVRVYDRALSASEVTGLYLQTGSAGAGDPADAGGSGISCALGGAAGGGGVLSWLLLCTPVLVAGRARRRRRDV